MEKEYIMFPDLAPRPPTPPSSNPPLRPPLLERDPNVSPSRSPARQPTPPTKSQGQKRKTTAPSTTRKKGTTKKAEEAPAKLAYEVTDEECQTAVAAEVKYHFAPVQPQPKEKIAPKTVQHFVDMLERPSSHVTNMPLDYDRCIKK